MTVVARLIASVLLGVVLLTCIAVSSSHVEGSRAGAACPQSPPSAVIARWPMPSQSLTVLLSQLFHLLAALLPGHRGVSKYAWARRLPCFDCLAEDPVATDNPA